MIKSPKKPKCFLVNQRYEVRKSDLPISCPMPKHRLWDAHPRVYLPIEYEGRVVCPYCGSKYILKDFKESIQYK